MACLRRPHLKTLMMDAVTFSALAPRHAVIEPVKADPQLPAGLDAQEQALYRDLYDRGEGTPGTGVRADGAGAPGGEPLAFRFFLNRKGAKSRVGCTH